ncbi:MAG: hypothetical protein NTX50_32570, partial [Candidatus Sumerlaeota bacterium]|nr:hypothetical protein [Candidatus Sumerlaeota bacterium]
MRLGKAAFSNGWEIEPTKTKALAFGPQAEAAARRKGRGRPETFDFLGFTHYPAFLTTNALKGPKENSPGQRPGNGQSPFPSSPERAEEI